MQNDFCIHFLFLCLMLSVCAAAFAQGDQKVPFLGEINTNHVNIRSGKSANFDKIGQLFKGEKIAVFAVEEDWYKIRLPRSSQNFIHSQYVRVISEEEGEVIGDRVNVRTGAGTDFPALTQLERGTMIHIVESVDGWYRFESLADIYGWVSKEYVTFKSNDISEVQQGVIFARSEDQPILNASEQKKMQKKVESKKVVKFIGTVERQDLADFKDIKFKLVTDDIPTCFLEGPSNLLDDFIRYKVEVEGVVYEEESKLYPFPVLHVQRIQLIL